MTRTELCAALAACCLCACAEQHGASGDDDTVAEPSTGQASADRPAAQPDGGGSGSGPTPASGTGGDTQRDAGAPAPLDAASSLPAGDPIDLCPTRVFSPDRLEALVAGAGTCSFVTDWPPIADPNFVNLYVGDRLCPRVLVNDMLQVSDGWRLEPDGRTVTLLGAACVDAETGARISVELACDWTIL